MEMSLSNMKLLYLAVNARCKQYRAKKAEVIFLHVNMEFSQISVKPQTTVPRNFVASETQNPSYFGGFSALGPN